MNDLIDSISPRGKAVQNKEIYQMIWRCSVLCELWTCSIIWGHFLYKYCVFERFFYCYNTTYGPISMKLRMAVKSHLTRFHQLSLSFNVFV